jgi:outer membrane receptor protein involved in Fe transport
MDVRCNFSLLVTTAIVSTVAGSPASAQSAASFSLPAQELSKSLKDVARATGTNVVFDPAEVKGKEAPPLVGQFTAETAIGRLIANQHLVARNTGSGTWIVSAEGNASGGAEGAPAGAQGRQTSGELASGPGLATVDGAGTIVVTGTRIRGSRSPSPVIAISSKQIREEGFTDLGEVIRSIPQNFSGGQNPGVVGAAATGPGGNANQNITGGSSLNLRGLGPDATLTLLNGRRLSYGGFVQSVDISAIPLEAVDRIEIVPDGASAIYGSDAVGGVGNVILKRDYDGAKIGVRYGGATDGGLATRELTATAGTRWSGGGLIATYQHTFADPIYARQRDYTEDMFDPSTLYPQSKVDSGLVSLHQSIGDAVELRLDAFKTKRSQELFPWNSGLTPYYFQTIPQTETSLVAPSIEISLPEGWMLSAGAGWGRDEQLQRESLLFQDSSPPQVFFHHRYYNSALSGDVGAEGPLFVLPGGDVRLAIGAGFRKIKYTDRDLLTDSSVTDSHESTRFAYGELSLPLIGPSLGVTAIRRLDVTAALRTEDYSSFGSVTTPKLGLIYSPNQDFTLKASWGRSFKAPTLLQRYQVKSAVLDNESYYGGSGNGPNATVLELFGGDPNLQPERASTKTLSLQFHPESLQGFEAELSGFDIDYRNRVVQPITDIKHAIGNPDYAQFIDYSPTPQKLQEIIDSAAVFYNYAGQPYDPSDVVATVFTGYANVARQRIKGLDFSGSYRFDLGPGQFSVRGSATWLNSTQQNAPTQKPYDVAGRLFAPAKLHARLGAVWNEGGLSASTFINYVSGVTDSLTGEKTDSFTTLDATVRYSTGQRGALAGIEVALSAQNLFDQAPPSYAATSPADPAYDSTNYSAIGRFVSLSISKKW